MTLLNLIQTHFKTFKDTRFLAQLKQVAVTKVFADETSILRYGDEIQYIPLVTEGMIRVLREDVSGREILLYHISPGQSCIMSILGGKRGLTSEVRAIVAPNTHVILFPAKLVLEWSETFLDWNEFVFNLYHLRFEELVKVVDELAFNRVDERILALLNTRSKLLHSQHVSMTHQQIADELGTAREVVSRLLKQLEKKGVIQLGRGKITLLN